MEESVFYGIVLTMVKVISRSDQSPSDMLSEKTER